MRVTSIDPLPFCTIEPMTDADNGINITFTDYKAIGSTNVYYELINDDGTVQVDESGDPKTNFQPLTLRPWKVIKKLHLYNWLAPVGKTYSNPVQTENVFERLERSADGWKDPVFKTLWWRHDAESVLTLNCNDNTLAFTTNALGVDNILANPKLNLDGNVAQNAPLQYNGDTCKVIVAEITPTKEGTIDTSRNLQTIRGVGGSIGSPAEITPSNEGLTYKWGIYDASKTGDARYTTAKSNDYIQLVDDGKTITGLQETPAGKPVTVWAEVIEPDDGNYWNYPDKIRTTWDVEVVRIPVTVNADIIRFTGRKLQNAIDPDLADRLTYKDDRGNAVTDLNLSSQAASADWTPVQGKAEFANGLLKPTAVGNEKMTAQLTSNNGKYKIANGKGTMNVDIYGYQFAGETEQSFVKGSDKDLAYKIELVSPSLKQVTPVDVVVEDDAIFSKLVRIDIMDEQEQNVICTLTDNGDREGKDYDLTSGSVKIELKAAYLETLSVGTYKLIGYFAPETESGAEVDTLNVAAFTVKEQAVSASAEPTASESPSTGENSGVMTVNALLMLLSTLGMCYAYERTRKTTDVL